METEAVLSNLKRSDLAGWWVEREKMVILEPGKSQAEVQFIY